MENAPQPTVLGEARMAARELRIHDHHLLQHLHGGLDAARQWWIRCLPRTHEQFVGFDALIEPVFI